jgi:hypothetical protein
MEGYIINKALGLCTDYLSTFPHTHWRVWDDNDEFNVVGMVMQGRGAQWWLEPVVLFVVHKHIVINSIAIQT